MKGQGILFVAAMIFISAGAGFGNVDVYIFGKGTFVNSSGSASDYKAGENDFPLASSRTNMGMGVGIAKDIGPLFLGFEAHFNLGGTTTLKDTSDNDTVKINSYKSWSALAVIGVNILHNRTKRIFVDIGGGFTRALGTGTRTYTSRLGYETQIGPPAEKMRSVLFGGLGLIWNISSSTGILIRGRFQSTGMDVPEKALVAMAGVNFSL